MPWRSYRKPIQRAVGEFVTRPRGSELHLAAANDASADPDQLALVGHQRTRKAQHFSGASRCQQWRPERLLSAVVAYLAKEALAGNSSDYQRSRDNGDTTSRVRDNYKQRSFICPAFCLRSVGGTYQAFDSVRDIEVIGSWAALFI